ncbi:GtrA family protein [Natrinema pellirubrum DSM 15624]|uniref:GtrA family protein n=1 Tax=Natrinema pellirubrum (strain DSM 15624 / CIP 106293 / JCM 10476 / NCIMB 786 / 157) TaxID=797303 RepID=L0JQB9_NATP1|nr:GtrA family protein [Natrinema pellirubrum]AGB32792.1 putative membrane protein [Natrinema pellirubrum DSM 15624]ELY75795.1 GtrA family protein [Natrinema pellirubrum DSM 15624]
MSDSLTEAVRTRARALLSTTRFGQFVGVGAVGATVDNVVLVLLVEATFLGPVVAKLLSWELGIAVIFAINERWTFSEYGEVGLGPLVRRFLRSNVVRFGGFLVTLAVLTLLVRRYAIWYVAANVVGIGVGFFVNYTCESLYTWQVHQD